MTEQTNGLRESLKAQYHRKLMSDDQLTEQEGLAQKFILHGMSPEAARERAEELHQKFDDLLQEGILYVVGYRNGQRLLALTEKGKRRAEEKRKHE